MALTANRDVDHYVDQELRTFPLAAGVKVYRGAFVGLRPDGYARPLVEGDRFCGIAYQEGDNTGGASGGTVVRTYTFGDFALPVAGLQGAARFAPVFATDDGTLGLQSGARASYAGRVLDVLDGGRALVRIGPPAGCPGDLHDSHLVYMEDFMGAGLDVSGGAWRTVDVGGATQGVVAGVHGGAFSLALTATNEAQDAVLYHGDSRNFDLDHKLVFECRAKVTTPGTGVALVFGLAGDHDADKDSIAAQAWFRLEGGLDLLVETDDGTNDNDDVDTLLNLTSGTWHDFRIDLTDPGDVQFLVDGQRLLPDTKLDMSNYAGSLQPYFSLDKAGGTGTATLTLDRLRITGTRK